MKQAAPVDPPLNPYEPPGETSAAALAEGTPSLTSARLLVLAAALMWSSGGFFAKAHTFDGWPGPALAFWRAALACIVLLPLVRRVEWTWKLLPMATMFVLMNYSYLTAMVQGSAANAIWLQMTAPVWVLLVGVLVFGERATWRDGLLVAFAAAGVGIILYYESQGESLSAVLWGLASGAFYAGIVLSLRQLRTLDSSWLAAVNHVSTALALAYFALGGLVDANSPTPFPAGIQWGFLAGFGILQLGLPYVLFARGLRSLPGHEAAGIGLVEPVLVPVWVYLAWGQKPAWWTLVGGGLILVGLVLRYLRLPAFGSPAGTGDKKGE
ncbi:MAG: EamA family transporter [Pirellulaceae bacterium]|nr:EamA family transporter [Pirellulaceae bacterium]